MKHNFLKKTAIILLAVFCALSIHASAETGDDIIGRLFPWLFTTQAQDPPPDDPGTQTPPTETPPTETPPTEMPPDTPVIATGNGDDPEPEDPDPPVQYTTPQVVVPNYTLPTVPASTTAPTTAAETTTRVSLSDIFERESAAVIVPSTQMTFTLSPGVVVADNEKTPGVTWQMAALIGAAALFVILGALMIAMIAQRRKLKKNEKFRPRHSYSGDSLSRLGSSDTGRSGRQYPAPAEEDRAYRGSVYAPRTSRASAEAIKYAAMTQRDAGDYADDAFMRKYADEPAPVTYTRGSSFADEDMSGADLLRATDSMMREFGEDLLYSEELNTASAAEYAARYGIDPDALSEADFEMPRDRVCPQCGQPVPDGDLFCHNCGTFIE